MALNFYIICVSRVTHTKTHSYLVFGIAEQLLLGLHEVNSSDRARVPSERKHQPRGHKWVPQQDLMVHTRCGCSQ